MMVPLVNGTFRGRPASSESPRPSGMNGKASVSLTTQSTPGSGRTPLGPPDRAFSPATRSWTPLPTPNGPAPGPAATVADPRTHESGTIPIGTGLEGSHREAAVRPVPWL